MFAIVKYINHHREVSFDVLSVYFSFKKAKAEAQKLAFEECLDGDEVVNYVDEEYVHVNAKAIYSIGGDVFAVMELPVPKDDPESSFE